MIVVINPSGSAGQSFKGLHAYCAHDQERAETSERVDWIDTRNIAANDPAQAWKIMAATARAQNDIKRSAGVRTGKAPKDGAVLHVVLSFADGEPMSRDAVQAAADEFLSELGVDPAKMRSKNKPRRQFADEHQAVMYAHTDTENTHVHLMINRVHPETGIVLPSNNDQLKAQKWALEYSKRHGTDHLTPSRDENREMRENGEYVKGNRRKSRNVYEQEAELTKNAANDNDHVKAFQEQQRKKDAALALRGRNLTRLQDAAWDKLAEAHKHRKAALARDLQKKTNQAKAETREDYRPKWRDLRKEQESEKVTFAELEKSFFGRAANAAKLSANLVREQRSGVIARTFRIISSAGARKEFFERAQQRTQSALQRELLTKVQSRTQGLKAAQAVKLTANRAVFAEQRDSLEKTQTAEQRQLKADWKTRTSQRHEAVTTFIREHQNSRNRNVDDVADRYLEKWSYRAEFEKAQKEKSPEQDNKRDRDGGRGR